MDIYLKEDILQISYIYYYITEIFAIYKIKYLL